MDVAIAAVKAKIGDRGLPRETALGDLDDDALEYIAGAAVYGFYSSRMDSAPKTDEAERLLPELTKVDIDWGRPMANWSHQGLVKLIKFVSWLVIERHLRCRYMAFTHHWSWPLYKKVTKLHREWYDNSENGNVSAAAESLQKSILEDFLEEGRARARASSGTR
jgi:hypothetical protein